MSATFTQNSQFENKIIDNDGFFDAIERELPLILSAIEIHKATRLELQDFFTDMKKQKRIQGVTQWTAIEQRSFFNKLREGMQKTGGAIREQIRTLIEEEITREISDNIQKASIQDSSGNTMIYDTKEYEYFLEKSFLLAKETTFIPMDLRLTINGTETIQEAKKKLAKYGGKYNALILVDEGNCFKGVIRAESLEQDSNMHHTVSGCLPILPGAFGHYSTTSSQLKETMQAYHINILPIIDSRTGILIGILTGTSLEKKEIEYYSTTSLTNLSLDYFKGHK